MATKAFGYTRVSSTGQVKGYGPQRQREDIAAFADSAGYEIVRYYEDAHTGTEADRPAFIEMIGEMMSNGVRVVIVESLDRFARDLLVQTTLLAKLASEGLTLIAANTGTDVTAAVRDDPMRKAMVAIQGVFAQLEKDLLVKKLARGRDDKRKADGRCEGRLPFGSYEGEDVVLAEIKRLCRKPRGAAHRSYGEIADALNGLGFRTRYGKRWLPQTVRKIALQQGFRQP